MSTSGHITSAASQAEVDALKRLQAETGAELDALLPAILLSSPGYDGTGDRAQKDVLQKGTKKGFSREKAQSSQGFL